MGLKLHDTKFTFTNGEWVRYHNHAVRTTGFGRNRQYEITNSQGIRVAVLPVLHVRSVDFYGEGAG